MKLPNFLICGAQKAGTTALYAHLKQHPDVFMSTPKETEFFNWRFRRGWTWFAKHFEGHTHESAIGEASTRTMATPEAPARIYSHMPNVHLIFLLRNPIERAFSAFYFYKSQGIVCAGNRFSSFIRNEGHPLRHELIDHGRYDRHLSRFDDLFDREQILLLRYDLFKAEPKTTLEKVAQFIGVNAGGFSHEEDGTRNVTKYPATNLTYAWAAALWKPIAHILPLSTERISQAAKNTLLSGTKPKMDQRDREYLRALYEDTITRVAVRLDDELTSWL
jgi:hypothetical protein